MNVSGKVAFVTGGAGGIGLAVVKKLLENDAKAVAVVDVSESNGAIVLEDLSQLFGNSRVIFIKADVTQEKELIAAFEKTIETFKNLDIVINNAGIVNEVDWEKSLNVLLLATIRGTYLALQNYLPKFKSGDEGIIVNTASIFGINPSSIAPMYSVSKRGIVALGETLGTEGYYNLYQSKILTICPGHVNTSMMNVPADKFILTNKVEETRTESRIGCQRPEFVAQKYVDIINKGQNGSIWVIEDEEDEYQVVFPDRKSMKL